MNLLKKIARPAIVVLANVVLTAILLFAVEYGYRIKKEGFSRAGISFFPAARIPYCYDSPAHNLIFDSQLGYRLNSRTADKQAVYLAHQKILIPKPPGLFRAIFLGDSLPALGAHGNFVSLVAREFSSRPGMEIINAGIFGYTTYQELLFLKRDLLKTSPDLVVLCYSLNDNHKYLHQIDTQGRMLLTREAHEAMRIRNWFDALVSHSYVLREIKLQWWARRQSSGQAASAFPWDNTADFAAAWNDYSWRDAEKNLRIMKSLLAKNRARLAMVVFPFEPQLSEKFLQADAAYVLKPQRKLQAIAARYDIPLLDLFPVFEREQREGARLFTTDGIHLTVPGDRLVAAEIARFLKEQGLVVGLP